MIITKMSLPRRTFLRGMGATLALPLLDAMVPALSAGAKTAAGPAQRLAIAYVPNGKIMSKWTPTVEGAAFELTPLLAPLAPYRDQLLVMSGLTDGPAMPATGEGSGDHVRAAASFLTGVRPRRTEGADIQAGVSMDQILAQKLGQQTQWPSLELCLESNGFAGACEAGYSCAYSNTLSWRTPTTPLPMENDPRAVFERLFGDNDNTTAAVRIARMREQRSILDSLLDRVTGLQRKLGAGDRGKLTQYLDAIRDIEVRIHKAEAQSGRELPLMDRPVGAPAAYDDHARLMFDLQVLAFQSDLTRVITFLMAREASPRPYPEIGIPDAGHALSHHGRDPEKMEKFAKINNFHVTLLAYFLGRLQSTPDGDGTLLDHSIVLYGSGISDGNEHLHTDLPILLAGGGVGQGGRHVRSPKDTPLANLQLTLLDKLGVPIETLGDSTSRIDAVSDAYISAI